MVNFNKKIFYSLLGIVGVVVILEITLNVVSNFITIGWLVDNLFILLSVLFFIVIMIFIVSALPHFQEISKNDKKVYKKLIEILDLDDGEVESLLINTSSIPSRFQLQFRFHEFIDNYRSVNNHINNKRLSMLFSIFVKNLEEYLDELSNKTIAENGLVKMIPELKRDNPKDYDKALKNLDSLANKVWKSLQELIKFGSSKNIHK